MTTSFILQNAALGVGLAMDAFAVSLANGLSEPRMKAGRMSGIAGVFGGFQFLMPMIGWLCVHTLLSLFDTLTRFVPYAALALLSYIGIHMILDGVHSGSEEERKGPGFGALLIQGVATSIDALSVGFTLAELNTASALYGALIIGAVTFVICLIGLAVGKRFGTLLAGKAQILGGVILIGIGIKILLESLL